MLRTQRSVETKQKEYNQRFTRRGNYDVLAHLSLFFEFLRRARIYVCMYSTVYRGMSVAGYFYSMMLYSSTVSRAGKHRETGLKGRLE